MFFFLPMDPAAPRFSSLLLDARVRGRKGTICFLGIAKLGKNISIPDRLLFKESVKGLAHLGGIHGATAFAGNLAWRGRRGRAMLLRCLEQWRWVRSDRHPVLATRCGCGKAEVYLLRAEDGAAFPAVLGGKRKGEGKKDGKSREGFVFVKKMLPLHPLLPRWRNW